MLIAHRIALDPNNAQVIYMARAAGTGRLADAALKPSAHPLAHERRPRHIGVQPSSTGTTPGPAENSSRDTEAVPGTPAPCEGADT